MPTSPLSVVLQHLQADLRLEGVGMTDGELLARFVGSRDENARAALVRRHASMVWGVCCRLLHNHHDAEDAFQATFLVLVRKATSVPRQAVANWLYGVARQTAVRLRATAAKRRRRETQVVNMPEPTVPEVRDADLQRVVDEELSRLPDHYRGVVVLCDLEGMTRREAARQLAIPEGSVASRLARARAMLAKRLTQRSVVFTGGSVAAVSSGSASASAPPVLVASTIKATSLLAAGQAAGVVSAKVAALTEGVLKTMLLNKLKAAVAVVLVLSLMATGVGVTLTYRTVAAQGGEPVAVVRPQEKKEVEADTDLQQLQGSWTLDTLEVEGKEIDKEGNPLYQLRFADKELSQWNKRGEKHDSSHMVRLDSAKNPKEIDVTWQIIAWQGIYKLDGDKLTLCVRYAGEGRPSDFTTKPGSQMLLLVYKRDQKKADDKKPTAEKPVELAAKQEKEKEGFTAWGKAVGVLQAGLGFRPGEKRAYGYGETVTLVVRVRNVGKNGIPHEKWTGG